MITPPAGGHPESEAASQVHFSGGEIDGQSVQILVRVFSEVTVDPIAPALAVVLISLSPLHRRKRYPLPTASHRTAVDRKERALGGLDPFIALQPAWAFTSRVFALTELYAGRSIRLVSARVRRSVNVLTVVKGVSCLVPDRLRTDSRSSLVRSRSARFMHARFLRPIVGRVQVLVRAGITSLCCSFNGDPDAAVLAIDVDDLDPELVTVGDRLG